jgi:hypothetical protein
MALFSLSGERKFDNVINHTPENVGPGVYETTPVMGKHARMKAPFGTRGQRVLNPPPVDPPPPPGEYNSKPLNASVVVRSPFFSDTKRPIYYPDKNPGPGQYGELDDYSVTPPRQLHHKRLRTGPLLTGFVGQDVLGYVEAQSGGWTPMKKPRRNPNWLGPGCYEPAPGESERHIDMTHRARRDLFGALPGNPGPGTYSPLSVVQKLPISISTITRDAPPPHDDPNCVEPRSWAGDPAAETSAAFRSREGRVPFPLAETTPSPVSYYHPKRTKFDAGDGLGHRSERNFGTPLNDHPGPGTYELRPRWASATRSALDRSVQSTANPTDWVPGPGRYQLRKTWSDARPVSKSVFVSRSRRDAPGPEPVPAPGSYDPKILDPVGKVPAIIHESRFQQFGDWVEHSKIANPAPDAYQAVRIAPGRGRTISSISRTDQKNQMPGPGQYDVVHGSLQKRSKNVKAPQAPIPQT